MSGHSQIVVLLSQYADGAVSHILKFIREHSGEYKKRRLWEHLPKDERKGVFLLDALDWLKNSKTEDKKLYR